MNDLISRQAAIRWVKTECNPYGNPTLEFESGKKVIEHLEKMPPAPQWIPCSERLPEPNEKADHVWRYYLVQNEYGDMMVATYRGNRKGESWWEQMYVYRPTEDAIVAWMPLPEPYKEETDE